MKKAALCSVVMLVLAASACSAAGLNLAWTNCFGEGAPVTNRNFACNSNSGVNIAVASFIVPADMPSVTGNEMAVDIQTAGSTLPNWWAFKNTGTCRLSSLSANFIINGAAVVCMDEFGGAAAGGIGSYTIGYNGNPTRAHLIVVSAVPSGNAAALTAGAEYFAMNVNINNQKTAGAGACAGCTTPACIAFTSLKLTQPVGVGDLTLTTPAVSNVITWQGGVNGGCPPSPSLHPTWGVIKSLLR